MLANETRGHESGRPALNLSGIAIKTIPIEEEARFWKTTSLFIVDISQVI